MRDIDPREEPRDGRAGRVGEKKKSADARKKETAHTEKGINCTGDTDLFERDTLP